MKQQEKRRKLKTRKTDEQKKEEDEEDKKEKERRKKKLREMKRRRRSRAREDGGLTRRPPLDFIFGAGSPSLPSQLLSYISRNSRPAKYYKMPASEYAPRLNFLRDSASSLSSLSPSTAAHLLSVHNHILHDDLRPLNQRQQDFCCGTCGTIRKPEKSRTFQVKKKKSKRASSFSDGATIYKCLCCRRRAVKPHRKEPVRTKLPSRTAAPAPEVSTAITEPSTEKTVSQQPDPEPVEASKAKTAENANSKKRAKARRQGGLQALLASKQQSQPASSSLDLFDFLQQ